MLFKNIYYEMKDGQYIKAVMRFNQWIKTFTVTPNPYGILLAFVEPLNLLQNDGSGIYLTSLKPQNKNVTKIRLITSSILHCRVNC